MKKSIFLVATIFLLTTLACGFNLSTANIASASLAKDAEGQRPTTVFNQDDVFYALVELRNAPDDTTVKAVWTAVETDSTDPDFVIDENSLTSGDDTIQFSLINDNLWPVGKYKVDLYLNDTLDRTLGFTVEGNAVAQEPTSTPQPTASPTPQPTATPEPTPTPTLATSSGDSLVALVEEPAVESTEEATEEPESLPLQAEPYLHRSGAFTFAVPEGWELINEDKTSASFGDGQTYVGAVFTDGQIVYNEQDMQNYIDLFVEQYLGSAESYELIEQKAQPDDSIYVALSYATKDGNGDVDFFFEQRDTIVFVLVFDTPVYNELQPTWDEIIASYAVDPEAALAAVPTPTPVTVSPTATPKPLPPTPTPAPAVNPFMPQSGRARLYVFNEFNQELTFTIDNKEHKIPPAGIDNPTPIDLNPGRYTFTVSIPGGAANGEVTLAADQSWAVGVRGDGAVYNPFQVYP